jgi:chromate transport protein ChrA
MAAVTFTLVENTLLEWRSWVLAVLAAVLLSVFKLSPLWLIPASSIAGWLLFQF